MTRKSCFLTTTGTCMASLIASCCNQLLGTRRHKHILIFIINRNNGSTTWGEHEWLWIEEWGEISGWQLRRSTWICGATWTTWFVKHSCMSSTLSCLIEFGTKSRTLTYCWVICLQVDLKGKEMSPKDLPQLNLELIQFQHYMTNLETRYHISLTIEGWFCTTLFHFVATERGAFWWWIPLFVM